ncbi:hypothetical protein MINTMi198_48420 [Mycobacterium intracellulare M.i.198]|nr:hypothetical protein MINTM016_47580 [Mycobacterium intracellulare]BCP39472.1 hypothetical protein MINTMi198_48420 [Mycobacterium intracellulare M.i.198]
MIRGGSWGRIADDVEAVLIDGHPARGSAFDEHHADCLRCHRHTEYDLHRSSQIARRLVAVLRQHSRAGAAWGFATPP